MGLKYLSYYANEDDSVSSNWKSYKAIKEAYLDLVELEERERIFEETSYSDNDYKKYHKEEAAIYKKKTQILKTIATNRRVLWT